MENISLEEPFKWLEDTSQEFRILFLLKFTKALIENSKEGFFVLDHHIRKSEIKKEAAKKILENKKQKKEDEFILSMMHKEPFYRNYIDIGLPPPLLFKKPQKKEALASKKPVSVGKNAAPVQQMPRQIPPRHYKPLIIPEFPLPPTVQYIKPIPTNTQIDLGKLNAVVNDPAVKIIECNGQDEKIVVKGNMGVKPTNITLTKEELNSVLESFSQASKIPLHEGIYKIAVGKLILSAIISDIVGSKFIIRKMEPQIVPGIMRPGMPPGRPLPYF